ncbi:vWA domain-containing protein [Rhizobium sp. NRK18]|uniref:vWA domain-containing protein n=1 Tax=Rhizobium sp. NRK18 TaxID=2964667 RepID=UPI0021C47AF7|nr:TadE/TadG family type IV pilus assembly protein [Rhizobium sp. NRK18]MCQ2005473.1 VWA domain-containing protein [Rhizobium sp. NRK18]
MTNLSASHAVKQFFRSRDGNFAILTALSLPVVIAFVGVAIDMSRLLNTRTQLQSAADSAALVASKAMADQGMTEAQAKVLALNFVNSQLALDNDLGGTLDKDNIDIVPTKVTNADGSGTYDVQVKLNLDVKMTAMTGLLGIDSRPVSVNSAARTSTESTKSPLSMYLVLDRSGSMAWDTDQYGTYEVSYDCSYWTSEGRGRNKVWEYHPKTCTYSAIGYIPKIYALKQAVSNLMAQLAAADPEQKYVRTAAVSYNSDMDTPLDLDWGTAKTLAYVDTLIADGGTDSSQAVTTARNALHANSEDQAHKKKNGGVPVKYMVFMTDGENNDPKSDTKTKKECDDAKREGTIIYTVAFMAPAAGKALLSYCATDAAHYFDASNASDLIAAFNSIGAQATSKVSRLTQ